MRGWSTLAHADEPKATVPASEPNVAVGEELAPRQPRSGEASDVPYVLATS